MIILCTSFFPTYSDIFAENCKFFVLQLCGFGCGYICSLTQFVILAVLIFVVYFYYLCFINKANNLSIFHFDFKGSTTPASEKKDVETKKLLVVSASDMSLM